MVTIGKKAKIERALREMYLYCSGCDCPVCGDEKGVVKVIYCPDCGIKLVQPSLCKICGNPVNATSGYCSGCGTGMVRDE